MYWCIVPYFHAKLTFKRSFFKCVLLIGGLYHIYFHVKLLQDFRARFSLILSKEANRKLFIVNHSVTPFHRHQICFTYLLLLCWEKREEKEKKANAAFFLLWQKTKTLLYVLLLLFFCTGKGLWYQFVFATYKVKCI